jgi:hypothetical protein
MERSGYDRRSTSGARSSTDLSADPRTPRSGGGDNPGDAERVTGIGEQPSFGRHPVPASSIRAGLTPAYPGDVATHPVEFDDDFTALVARTRREMIAAGEHKAPAAGVYEPPFGVEAREAIMALVRDGTYREAARRVTLEDPELADL